MRRRTNRFMQRIRQRDLWPLYPPAGKEVGSTTQPIPGPLLTFEQVPELFMLFSGAVSTARHYASNNRLGKLHDAEFLRLAYFLGICGVLDELLGEAELEILIDALHTGHFTSDLVKDHLALRLQHQLSRTSEADLWISYQRARTAAKEHPHSSP